MKGLRVVIGPKEDLRIVLLKRMLSEGGRNTADYEKRIAPVFPRFPSGRQATVPTKIVSLVGKLPNHYDE